MSDHYQHGYVVGAELTFDSEGITEKYKVRMPDPPAELICTFDDRLGKRHAARAYLYLGMWVEIQENTITGLVTDEHEMNVPAYYADVESLIAKDWAPDGSDS